MSERDTTRNPTRLLLAAAATVFILAAVCYNPLLVNLVVRAFRALLHRATHVPPASRVFVSELWYAAVALLLLVIGLLLRRVPRLDAFARRASMQRLTLILMATVLPFFALEMAVRPFSEHRRKETSVFVKDKTRGWKLRPGARGMWGGVPVTVNGKGLRGPELQYEKPDSTRRILFLGDSVIFGYMIEHDDDALPAVIERELAQRTRERVECINAGCGGYSPWQEFEYLKEEGYKYDPDVVVAGFVLNDVTEKFELVRFGGTGEGVQMSRSYYSRLDNLLSRSALVTQLRRVWNNYRARQRLGADVRLGAVRQQKLDVQTLIDRPDQENVGVAWQITLMNLHEIVDYCRELNIDFRVVVFPFAMQLPDPEGSSAPQQRLLSWTQTRNIPILDLLPPLAARAASDTTRLFLDEDHLSIEGVRVAAPLIADFLEDAVVR